jgi:hypothetical protein
MMHGAVLSITSKYGLLPWKAEGDTLFCRTYSSARWPRSCSLPRMQKCPRCDSQYIRASCSKSTLDSVVKWLLNKLPFRCRKCRVRFYSREPQHGTDSFGKPYRHPEHS